MHDARWFEEAGLPACALISSGFIPQARYQAQILDAINVPQVFVPHPISDQTKAQMYEKANASFDQVYDAITTTWIPADLDDVLEADRFLSGSSVGTSVGGVENKECST